jgi:mannose-6-phosphate isomerase-like protein (cupin superfamily)
LRTAAVAAAAVGAPLSVSFWPATAEAQGFNPEPFQLLSGGKLQKEMSILATSAGKRINNPIFGEKALPFTFALTIERETIDTQFEYHDDRDHLFQILDGETTYEVGGTPQGGHAEKPGQWHSPTSVGTSVVKLQKGDMLLIPRGMPHKRATPNFVTFLLISATTPMQR